MENREEAILEESEQVRFDLGYPILVSPFAQYVVTQAMLNVVQGKRYATIPAEIRRYVLGCYGRLAGPVLPEILDRVLEEAPSGSEVITGRAGELIPPALDQLRTERGPFDSDDDLLLAVFYTDAELQPLRTAKARGDGRCAATGTPVAQLLEYVASRSDLGELDVQYPGMHLRVRR